jgi:uncharacterized protein YlxW (UPF0749 family)
MNRRSLTEYADRMRRRLGRYIDHDGDAGPRSTGSTANRTSAKPTGAVASGAETRTVGLSTQPELSVDFLTELFRNPLDAGYGDAAASRARSGPPGRSARRTGFTLRTVTLIATGLLLAVAYQQTVAAQPEAATTRHSLAQDVQQRQAETDAQQKQAEQLRQQAASLRDAIVGPNASALDQVEARAGLGAVTGGGATVTLASGPAPTDPVTGKPESTDQGHIVDFDLQVISNELWHDGAEAIAINGQRLIATSTIRAAGSAILVDLAPLSEPYTIQAIGPSSLANALRRSAVGGFYNYLATSYGVRFAVQSAAGLRLPAAADPGLHYAKPIAPPSAEPSPTGPSSPGSGSGTSSPPASKSPRATPSTGGP